MNSIKDCYLVFTFEQHFNTVLFHSGMQHYYNSDIVPTMKIMANKEVLISQPIPFYKPYTDVIDHTEEVITTLQEINILFNKHMIIKQNKDNFILMIKDFFPDYEVEARKQKIRFLIEDIEDQQYIDDFFKDL